MDLELKGKSVIVTGGGSNIGRAITLTYAQEGANITLAEIEEEQANMVAEEAHKRGASDIQVIKTDVTDLDQVKSMVEAATRKYGGVDILVNNVGWDRLMFFTQTTPDFWERIIQINYMGVLNCTHTVLKVMLDQERGGSIVSISSDASRQGEAREAVYGGVKAAINSFMKSVAKENGRYGIRCNVVCPGVTVPESGEPRSSISLWNEKDPIFKEDLLPKVAAALPLKRIGRPQDVANAVVFLSSNAASYVTGQVLSVSGGYSMVG